MSGTDNTAAFALKYLPPKGVITTEVKATLCATFGGDDITVLANSTPIDILPRIETALPDSEADWLDIAMAMIEALGQTVRGTAQAAPQPTHQLPQHIVVETARGVGELSTYELLERLTQSKHKGSTNEVILALQAKPDVIKAIGMTEGAIVVLTADDKLNPQATYDYIGRLGRKFGRRERQVNGKAPTTLDRALKRSEMVTLNPLTKDVEYVGVANEYGIVMSDVPSELYQAVAWAEMSGHGFFPPPTIDQVELTRHHQELFTPEGIRAQRILEDYRQAKKDGDVNTTIQVPQQLTEDQVAQLAGMGAAHHTPGQRVPTSQTATRGVDWEDVVRRHFAEKLSSTSRRVTGVNNNVSGHFTSLKVDGQGHRLGDVVVINSLTISGLNHHGSVIMPPHKSADTSGLGHNVRVTNATWEEIARLIGVRP